MAVSIEELTMNAWPAQQTVVHGGWLLRLAEGYTKRANSVHPFYAGDESEAALKRKIEACEAFYCRAGQDTIFKLTPFAPAGLDRLLESRGYVLESPSRVMLLTDFANLRKPPYRRSEITIECEDRLSYSWLDHMCAFSGIPSCHEGAAARIMHAITMKTGFFTLCVDREPAACGLGVLEGEYVGLYDIATATAFRGRGLGERLIRRMLQWAAGSGATRSYLQVAQSNGAANRLYARLSFEELYPYWYRIKKRPNG
ncbi:Acetyltransferase (GNAT) family protein [Paenibacillus sp. UNC496MF]|uniref:GNAT family N-acetyltransferase n=1 Tax=Paenibacillus sp. UNC496MF TaxID=1502753 RepID=UPI0008E4BD0A|nr:GNAT family N-acetyltransferase [Paenibacillus sp. UNC496MF]SFI27925.1 Acetyltransferase (GNAT) family protein [Paenibacillus sp. UNC496MF]